MRLRHKQSSRGFTLVEASISVFIVAVLTTAGLAALGTASATKLRQTDISRGYAAATVVMAEILQKPYTDGTATFGPQTGMTRSTFTDVDCYNGYTQSPPTYQNGTALPGYTGWTVSVAVAYVDPSTLAVTASDLNLKRITVTVTDPRGRSTKLTGLRSAYGRYDQLPATTTTYINYLGVDLQVGTNAAASVSGGVNPLNQVP